MDQAQSETAVVELPVTHSDLVQKVVGKRSWAQDIEEFRGIPYGTVPARWQHSVLRTSLPNDIYDATHDGPRCPQPNEPNNTDMFHSHLDFPDVGESEFDCLNLFIVRPSPTALARAGFEDARLPVYVYIHGGGYAWGAATDPLWDPTRLVAKSLMSKKPMIAVFINYRLHIFGFGGSPAIISAQPDSGMRGCNFGLGDQRIALRWVNQNITAFGGDPDKITLAGQSAGASSVHAHVIEAQLGPRKPLFRRAIMQSGALGTLGPISIEEASKQNSALLERLGIEDVDADRLVTAVREVPAHELLDAALKSHGAPFRLIDDWLTIKPSSVGRWSCDFGQVEQAPDDTENRREEPIVILLGYLEAEGQFFNTSVPETPHFETAKSLFVKHLPPSGVEKVLGVYAITPGAPLHDIHENITRLLSDVLFAFPAHLARLELSSPQASSARPTTVQNFRLNCGNPFQGRNHDSPHHNADMIYIYDCFYDDLRRADIAEAASNQHGVTNVELVNTIQTQWINFVTDDDAVTIGQDQAITYGKDRVARVVDIKSSPAWVSLQKRFEVIQRWPAAARVVQAILSEGVEGPPK